jgi:PhnB protein
MSVVAYLTLSDANAAIAFYKQVFGAVEKARMPSEDGKKIMHAELEFANGRLFLSDDFQNSPKGPARARTSVFVGYDKATDVDAIATKAKRADATITTQPQDMFWGDRFAQFTDPFGHEWMIGAPKDAK